MSLFEQTCKEKLNSILHLENKSTVVMAGCDFKYTEVVSLIVLYCPRKKKISVLYIRYKLWTCSSFLDIKQTRGS